MQKNIKFNQKKKLSAAQVYGEFPIWKIMVRIALPALLMSFMTALFTFVDMLLLVNFMPLTSAFDFSHLYLSNHNVFLNLVNSIQINNLNLQKNITGSSNNYEAFINYIANENNLHFYNTAATVRVASTLVSPLTFLITAVSGLLLPGANVLLSKSIGVKDRLKVIKVWQNEFYMALILALCGMTLIYILNYTLIDAMVGSSLDLNITANNIHNELNGTYYYTMQDNKLIFLIPNEQGYYTNAINTLSNVHYTSDIHSFVIKNNNQTVASTFVLYYEEVKNYAVKWAQDFVVIITSGLWIQTIVRIHVNVIRSFGRTGFITIAMVSDTLINILLDYILIYYGQIGMEGAATATLIAWSLVLIPLVLYFKKLNKEGLVIIDYKHLFFNNVMFNKKIIKQMLYISISYIISIICYMIVRVLLIHQIAYVTGILYPNLGNLYFISITGAIYPIMNLFQNTISGFMNAGTSIVSYNYGIKKYNRIRIVVYETSIGILVIGFTILGLIGFCEPISNWVLSLFDIHYVTGHNSLAYLYQCARRFLWIALMILPFRGLGNSAFMMFRTSKRYVAACMVALLRSILIVVPYLYIFSAIGAHELLPIQNVIEAKYNPIYNSNIWLVLWTQSAATITSNLITLIWIFWFMYVGIYRDKVPFKYWKLTLLIKKQHQDKILNETKIRR